MSTGTIRPDERIIGTTLHDSFRRSARITSVRAQSDNIGSAVKKGLAFRKRALSRVEEKLY